MTRFARARGSKSSNERAPEEASSWKQMKQQLDEKWKVPNKGQTEREVVCTGMKFEVSDIQESEWAMFEESPEQLIPGSNNKRKKHKCKVAVKQGRNISNEVPISGNENIVETGQKKKKQGSKTTLITKTAVKDMQGYDLEDKHEVTANVKITSQKKSMKKKRKNKQKIKQTDSGSPYCETERENASTKDTSPENRNENYKRKFDGGKIRDKSHKRRKLEMHAVRMFINGKEIEVVKFDGFPVKKEDAEHLEKLRQKLREEGIAEKEVDGIMKKERRKAEKGLARERKKVCFHCRSSGHVLSQCPELGSSNDSGTGICFKCGSTEHTHFQCQVIRSQDFRYAVCFVCNEQGHIARQCPDNPRGLYPKGGACKVCGDVTHLKKDCPDLIKEKEQQTITLQTLDNSSLDILEEEMKDTAKSPGQNRVKKGKVVKF